MSSPDLSGTWTGAYSYPEWPEPTSFVAVLVDMGNRFSGTIEETVADIPLFATVDGSRQGNAIRFLKTYDGAAGWSHTVQYEGTINAEATEIDGQWHVDGLTGPFLLMRPGRETVEKTTRAEAPADQR